MKRKKAVTIAAILTSIVASSIIGIYLWGSFSDGNVESNATENSKIQSYFTPSTRTKARPNSNDSINRRTLHEYLKREQYGSAPLLNGKYWKMKPDSVRILDSER